MAMRKIEQAEPEVVDALSGPLKAVALLVIGAAVVGAAYWSDRTYRQWLSENHPLAAPKARIERVRTSYRKRRALAAEVAEVIGDVLEEVARAIA